MRGASALDGLLAEFEGAPVRVLVVWEPVLKTDVVGPRNRTLGLVDDPRVAQFWDPGLVVSKDLVRSANTDPTRYGLGEPFPDDFIAWDLVAVFRPGASWRADLPVPEYYSGPVVDAIDEAREAIRRSLP